MIEKISDRILNFAFSNSDANADDETRQIYRYGVQLTLSTLTGILSVLVCGLLFGMFIRSVIFSAVIIPLRALIGGYHAKTYVKCCSLFILSFGTVCAVVSLAETIVSVQWLFVALAVGFLAVFGFTPAENKDKPICNHKKQVIRVNAVIVFSVMSVLSLLLISISRQIGLTIAVALCLSVIMLLTEVLIKRHTRQTSRIS